MQKQWLLQPSIDIDLELTNKAKTEFKASVGNYIYQPLPGDRKPALNYRD